MASLLLGRDAGRTHAGSHLLLLPDEPLEGVVVGLVRARYPEVVSTGDGGWRVGRWTVLRGPLLLDTAAAAGAGVPDPWRCAWVLQCPVERGDPPLPGTTDREGLHRAFPDGLPVMAERRTLDLALALARRLEGAVRTASGGGAGTLLRPDPLSWVDRTVYSPHWASPQDVLDVAQMAAPGSRLATDAGEWTGLRAEAVAVLEATDARDAPAPTARETLHRAAKDHDAAALAGDDVLDAYAVVVALPSGGVVQLEVAGAPEAPPVLQGVPWADQAVTYTAAWWPEDPASAEHEVPAPDVRAARDEAAAVVVSLTDAVAAAVGGVVVDADGFPVD